MKRSIYAFFLLLSFLSFTQSTGIKAGANVSRDQLSAAGGGGSVSSDSKLSFLAGFYTEMELGENIFLGPEIILHMDGGQISDGMETFKNNFLYLSVPLLIKYYVSEKFSLHAGPQMGLLLSANVKVDGDSEDVSESLNPGNISFAFGAETHFNGGVNLGARMVRGISNISAEDVPGIEYRLHTVQIYLGFNLN